MEKECTYTRPQMERERARKEKKGGKERGGGGKTRCRAIEGERKKKAALSVAFAGVTPVFHVLPGGRPAESQSSSQLKKGK